MTIRVFSNGGGVQSIAMLVLSALALRSQAGDPDADAALQAATDHRYPLSKIQAALDFPLHLFCNVGDDSEHPDTIRYVDEAAIPYAAAHGITFEVLRRAYQRGANKGEASTLLTHMLRPEMRSIVIPLRMPEAGGAPGTRACTGHFKVRVIEQRLRKLGASKKQRAVVGLGISLDEFTRMRTDDGTGVQEPAYPLIDLRITRDRCMTIIRHAGLPVPPKSSCWFCPYHRPSVWTRMRADEPALFDQAADLEAELNRRRADRGQGPGYLTRFGVPLRQAIGERAGMDFADDDACESGYCMT